MVENFHQKCLIIGIIIPYLQKLNTINCTKFEKKINKTIRYEKVHNNQPGDSEAFSRKIQDFRRFNLEGSMFHHKEQEESGNQAGRPGNGRKISGRRLRAELSHRT